MRLAALATLPVDAALLWRSRHWSAERIAAYQNARLLEMLRHAVRHVPFYSALGLAPEAIAAAGDLGRFPVVTKADVQERGSELLSDEFPASGLYRSKSSGMTGAFSWRPTTKAATPRTGYATVSCRTTTPPR